MGRTWNGWESLRRVCFLSNECDAIRLMVPFVDFRRRFLTLLSFKFREFGAVTALSIIEAINAGVKRLDAGLSISMFSSFA